MDHKHQTKVIRSQAIFEVAAKKRPLKYAEIRSFV